ncbi:uncharacterized protein LOC115996105 [Ipomoea triloba]|uniref:uncharacterized protein LOC115996105 n=1 Tax=Ipomoea triloba TaxID=35885 RepID=UPI00125E23CD|nr:uncharacterized protein LOC115996105 [Ipomoea triloba]
MDKSWMHASRISRKYDDGVKEFLDFAKRRLPNNNGSYTKWIWHGEGGERTSTSNTYVDNEANEDDESEDRLNEMFRDVGEEFTDRSNELDELLTGNGWSDKSFTALLGLLKDMLPEDNELPKNTYDAKKILCPMGIEYEKIHACPNDCILFRNDYKELHVCPICGASRYKPREHVVGKTSLKGPPAKVLWYLPILPRFKHMFSNPSDAKNLTWHVDKRISDGKLRRLADSPQWKTFDNAFPEFGYESRNLRLGLCTDDLKKLWDEGVLVFDAYRKENFKLQAMLFCTINDFPAYGNLSGYSVKEHKACPICEENTCYYQLVHGRKTVYMGHRRFLDRFHPYRRLKKAFNGQQDYTNAPQPLIGIEVYERVQGINVTFGKTQKLISQRDIKGKTKDGLNARLDLIEMNIRVIVTYIEQLKRMSKLTIESAVQKSSSVDKIIVDPTSLSPLCQKAYKVAQKLEQNLVVHMSRGIVGDIEYDVYLEKLEIMRFLNMETMDISCLQFFIRYKFFAIICL